MDIFPASCAPVINAGGIEAFASKIQSIDFIDLAESAIRALEKISIEQSRSILEQASLDLVLNMMDFFEAGIQVSITKIVSNVCHNVSNESDFEKAQNMVPALTMQLDRPGSDIFENVCLSIRRLTEAPLKFLDPYNALDKVRPLMDKIAESGYLMKCFELIGIEERAQLVNQNCLQHILKTLKVLVKYSGNLANQVVQEFSGVEMIFRLLNDEKEDSKRKNIQQTVLELLDSLLPHTNSIKPLKDCPEEFQKNNELMNQSYGDIQKAVLAE